MPDDPLDKPSATKADRGIDPESDGRSDAKVVLQFFLVPLSLVLVLVTVFFGMQMLRRREPDPVATLRSLQSYQGFMARFVGNPKRWQSGYDLSLLMRGEEARDLARLVPDLAGAFREAGVRGDLPLRRYLALALGYSRDAAAVAGLQDGLRDADSTVRLFSAWGLMNVADAGSAPALRAAAGDPDPGVRTMVVFGLGSLGDREAAPILRAALGDPVQDVRWNAALSLARFGDAAAVPSLLELLDASVLELRGTPESEGARDRALNAVRGLALLRPPEGRARLLQLRASPIDPILTQAADLALQAYGAPAAPP